MFSYQSISTVPLYSIFQCGNGERREKGITWLQSRRSQREKRTNHLRFTIFQVWLELIFLPCPPLHVNLSTIIVFDKTSKCSKIAKPISHFSNYTRKALQSFGKSMALWSLTTYPYPLHPFSIFHWITHSPHFSESRWILRILIQPFLVFEVEMTKDETREEYREISCWEGDSTQTDILKPFIYPCYNEVPRWESIKHHCVPHLWHCTFSNFGNQLQ